MEGNLKLRYILKKIYYTLRRPKKLDFPEVISIELSTICNAKCKFCPHASIVKNNMRQSIMPAEIFKKIINDCIGYKNLKEIKPNLYGDPAVTPYLFDRLAYIRKKLPNVAIKIVTNGSELSKEKSDKLIKENLCDKINFSLDASNKETFEKFKGISWDKTLANIHYFIDKNNKHGRKIHVILSYVHTPENKGQFAEFKRMWKGKVSEFHIGSEVGVNRRTDFFKKNTNLPCLEPFRRLSILTDGTAVFCCVDAYAEGIVGNVKNNSISEIWNSEAFEKIRKLHLSKQKKNIPFCSKCSEWL
jgi:radical SAM protein with 4Fe4S-binding SPASM domain